MERMEIEECLFHLLEALNPIGETQKVHLTECHGRILAEDVYAGMMVPPFAKSAMDGYAVRAADVQGASKTNPVRLNVLGELLAGDYREISYETNAAVRVMTGSFVPDGFDAVVRQEDTDYGETEVCVYEAVKSYDNYCRVGEDIQKGDVVIKKNTRLASVHIGLLASLGIEYVTVRKSAKTALISTGTEIVRVGQALTPGKIYNSTAYMLAADIRREGLPVERMQTCADEEELLAEALKSAIKDADFVITTGAVSVGKRDIIPKVLENIGAKVLFCGANIQPGTPTLAGTLGGKVILSLSGNPYAAIANFEIYFWSAMAKLMQSESFETKKTTAVLSGEYAKVNKMRRFIRAYAEDGVARIPSPIHASSVIHNLTECNCFIDLRAGERIKEGDEVAIRYFKGSR